jgi:hypothetical protein
MIELLPTKERRISLSVKLGIVMRRLINVFGLLFFAAMLFVPIHSKAQMALPGMSTSNEGDSKAIAPTDVTPEAVRDMVSRMSDEEVRGMLLDRLDAVAKSKAETQTNASVIDFLGKAANGTWMTVFDAVKRLPVLVSSQKRSFTNFYDTLGGMGILRLFGSLLLGLFAGLGVERIVNLITRNWHAQAIGNDATLFESIKFLSFRLLKQIYGHRIFYRGSVGHNPINYARNGRVCANHRFQFGCAAAGRIGHRSVLIGAN